MALDGRLEGGPSIKPPKGLACNIPTFSQSHNWIAHRARNAEAAATTQIGATSAEAPLFLLGGELPVTWPVVVTTPVVVAGVPVVVTTPVVVPVVVIATPVVVPVVVTTPVVLDTAPVVPAPRGQEAAPPPVQESASQPATVVSAQLHDRPVMVPATGPLHPARA
jgi:hypothetical protein